MRFRRWVAVSSCLVMAGCGGSGDDSSGVNPSPTPSATPAPSPTPTPSPIVLPTPTPTPTFTAGAFPLASGDARGPTDFVALSFTQGTGGITFGVSAIDYGAANITANLTSGQFLFDAPGYQTKAYPASILTSPDGPSGMSVVLDPGNAQLGTVRLLNNFLPTQTVGDPTFQFRYLTFASIVSMASSTYSVYHVGGYLTVPTDLPRVARTYAMTVVSTYYPADQPANTAFAGVTGTGSLTYNPAASAGSRVSVSINLLLNRAGQQPTALGTVTGIGSVASDGSIAGSFPTASGGFGGAFAGALYGPQGAEAGLVINLQSVATKQQRIIGVVVGR